MSNSTSAADLAAEETVIYDIQVTFYAQVAACALIIYDISLTYADEIELVWRRRWTWGNLIFFLNRYFPPLQSIINIVSFIDPDLNAVNGNNLELLSSVWSIPVVAVIVESVLILRVSALYENSLYVVIGLWTLLALSFAAAATLASMLTSPTFAGPTDLPPYYGDYINISVSDTRLWLWIWVPSLIVETVLVSLTLFKTLRNVRSSVNTPVLAVILKDGVIYFLAILALKLANVILYALPASAVALQPVVTELEITIASVLCSRLYMNLRRTVYQQTYYQSERTITMNDQTFELHDYFKSNRSPAGLQSVG